MNINYDGDCKFYNADGEITFCSDFHKLKEKFAKIITQKRARKLVAKYFKEKQLDRLKTRQINQLYKVLGYDEDDALNVYSKLQRRELHPSGSFDNAGRFYSDNSDLLTCRSPSRAYPYSQMHAARTLRYVKCLIMSEGSTTHIETKV